MSRQVPVGLQGYAVGLAVDVGVGVTALPPVQPKPRSALLRALLSVRPLWDLGGLPRSLWGSAGGRVPSEGLPCPPHLPAARTPLPCHVKVSFDSGCPAFKPSLRLWVIWFDCGVFLKSLGSVRLAGVWRGVVSTFRSGWGADFPSAHVCWVCTSVIRASGRDLESFFFFLRDYLFLKVWYNLPVKPPGPAGLFRGELSVC